MGGQAGAGVSEIVRLSETKRCESCGVRADLKLPDGSFWCDECDEAARQLGYDERQEGASREGDA